MSLDNCHSILKHKIDTLHSFLQGITYKDVRLTGLSSEVSELAKSVSLQKYMTYKKFNNEETFNNLNGIEAFNKLSKYNLVELAVCYAYKKDTFLKNNYKFEEKTYHEDFGLIPYIIISSKKVTSINYIGYNYLQRKNSIMNNTDYEKEIKKSNDVLKHYKNLIKWSQNIEGDLTIYKSFIANSVILKSLNLKEKDYKNYIKKLKEYKVYDNLLTNNKENKIKKILIRISPKLYYKIIRGLK